MSLLNTSDYMKFPFEIGAGGPVLSDRRAHVRQQIEQVLFTAYRERWYRPEFGAGIHALVFEPNNDALRELTKKRLLASLASALAGEVDPKTLAVEIEDSGDDAQLVVTIAYTLAAINHTERQQFLVEASHG